MLKPHTVTTSSIPYGHFVSPYPSAVGITTPTRRTYPSAIGFTMDFDHIGGLRRVDVKTSHRHNLLNTLRALRLALLLQIEN